MGCDGSKALYVLRLALQQSSRRTASGVKSGLVNEHASPRLNLSSAGRPRRYVTTALRASPDTSTSHVGSPYLSSAHQSTWGPRHAASDIEYPSSDDFLEPSFLDDFSASEEAGCEYRMASMTLPERHVVPIRWPYSSAADAARVSQADHVPRRCDTLASLVVAGDLKTARIVYDELTSLHIGILRRAIYLEPSIACIDGTPAGLEAFLFWFNLVPNRPAMRAHTAFKAAYAPLIDRLLVHHANDARTLVQVLIAAAQKGGVLSAIFGPIVRHLVYLVPPATLVKVSETVWDIFAKITTSRDTPAATSSARAAAHALSASRRADDGWNALVRALSAAGYTHEATNVVQSKPDVEWQDSPLASSAAESADAVEIAQAVDLSHLPRLVRKVYAARRAGLRPKALAELLDTLSEHRPGLAARLVRRYETASASSGGATDADGLQAGPGAQKKTGSAMAERLAHARMLAFRDLSLHREVVERFKEAFYWVGIPDHPAQPQVTATPAGLGVAQIPKLPSGKARSWLIPEHVPSVKLYPTSTHLTTLFPPLLHTYHDVPSASGAGGSGSTHALAFVQALRYAVVAHRLSLAQASPGPGMETEADADITTTHAVLLDIIPAQALAHPPPPRLVPMPTTFAVLGRTICELYGPKAGLMSLEQAEEAIAALLRPLPGHQILPTPTTGLDDSRQTTSIPSSSRARERRTPTTQAPLIKFNLTPAERAIVSARVSTAQALVPSLDEYNAVLWKLAGWTKTDWLTSMLGDMYDARPIAREAQKKLLRTYTNGAHTACGWNLKEELDQLVMPSPQEKTLLGIAGILERAGKRDQAESIRVICRSIE